MGSARSDGRLLTEAEGELGGGDGTERGIGEGRLKHDAKRLRSEWRVLPKNLSTLAPGRVMEDCISGTDCSLVAPEQFVGQANAWFKRGPIHLDAGGRADTILPSEQQFACRGDQIGQAV